MIEISDGADEVIKKLFDSLKNRYQNNLQSMRDGQFVFDYVHLLYYKCHRTSSNRGGSYIDSPDWIKNKKATINLINKKDKLNYEETKKDHKELQELNLL